MSDSSRCNAEVACIGILVADVIGRTIDQYPERGHLQLVDSIRPYIGGCAANTGIGLGRLGVATNVIGKVGQDGFGDFVVNILSGAGVNAEGVATDPSAPTSATMVIVASDGERSFLHTTGANATFVYGDIDWSLVDGVKLVHIAGHFLMPKFDGPDCTRTLKRAKEAGHLTALDTAGSPREDWPQVLKPVLPYIDYLVPSFHEALRCVPAGVEQTPQAVARYFLDNGAKVVALKMGEAGSYVTDGQEEHSIPAFKVQAVDATGAGDAFAAGFLAGIVRGYSLAESARLGNATGALCVTEMGTTAGYRSLENTLKFMAAQM